MAFPSPVELAELEYNVPTPAPMVLRPRTAGILGASQVETQTESRPSMHSSLRALIALSLLACTSAVHMKIKVKNFTRWTYKVTQ
eukprot:1103238-Rhodomonas_salina.1